MSRNRKHLSSGGTHVGVISSGSALTAAQRAGLYRTLELISISNPGRRTLHHGCGQRADEAVHQMVRDLTGWRLHCHPAHDTAGRAAPQAMGTVTRLDPRDKSKPRRQRDADIVNASDIIVVVLPYPKDEKRSLPGIRTMIETAADAGRKVIYLQQPGRREGPAPLKPAPEAAVDARRGVICPQPSGRQQGPAARHTAPAPVPARQTLAWARLLGEQDREAGQLCRRYQDFLAKYASYGLVRCERVEQLWRAYASAEPKTAAPAAARPASPRPSERAVPAHGGIPREWYEDAVNSLGATAEVRDDGISVVVVYKVGGQVGDQYPEPRGWKAAVRDVDGFNKAVAAGKMNPALGDIHR